MAINPRRTILSLIGAGMMSTVTGACASAGPDTKLRHGLEIEVDKSVGRRRTSGTLTAMN